MIRIIRVRRLSGYELAFCALVAFLTVVITLLIRARTLGSDERGAVPPANELAMERAEAWCTGVYEFRSGRMKEAAASFKRAGDEEALRPDDVVFVDRGLALWTTLVAHRNDEIDLAITGWKLLPLPTESEVWRNVALAAAYLTKGDLKAADGELSVALRRAPDNPLVRYHIALLRLEEAATAPLWPDAAEPAKTKFVSLPAVMPHLKAMLRLAAADELERAVEAAERLDVHKPLIPADWTIEPFLRPGVADLLLAIRADHFLGTAHSTLGYLLMESGALERAEEHLDKAISFEAEVLNAYGELSDLYAAEGRHLDAARADLKAARKGPANIATLRHVMRHFSDAMKRPAW
jgi:tetratricopeptide (TPR) repeat protein